MRASSAPITDAPQDRVVQVSPDRLVQVSPERLVGWMDRFEARHGAVSSSGTQDELVLTAADGASAAIEVPFPPLITADRTTMVEHVLRERRVGVVLVRRGGYAVGLFQGPTLVTSKVGSAYVQGKTKAGGWSQQRYARRRANQAEHAYAEAADVVVSVLLPQVSDLEAIVGGGDSVGVRAVLADSRLAALRTLLQTRVLPTPDPRLRVLVAFPDQFRAVRITLNALA